MTHTETFTISEKHQNQTVEHFLKSIRKLSAAQIRSLKFQPDGICVNGSKVRVNYQLQENDLLKLTFHEKESSHIQASDIVPYVYYESEAVICIRKPSGIPTHPTGGHYLDSAENMLKNYYIKNNIHCALHCIGRLDIDTAGILIFAKNKIAAAQLWEQRSNGILSKEYLAICEGEFSADEHHREQRLEFPLNKIQDHPIKMSVQDNGLSSVTYYQALSTDESPSCQKYMPQDIPCTPVRLHIVTGRTHQIRVHMSHIGHPLVGDPLYGNGIPGKDHALLFMHKLKFIDPASQLPVSIDY